MTWLVTGASGLLGATAVLKLNEAGERVVGVSRSALPDVPTEHRVADLSRVEERRGIVASSDARVVLHAAAVATIEACERDPVAARELNVQAPADLAAQAAQEGARFIHISTDAVFDGDRGGYGEADAPRPTGVYGRTKLDGERAVMDANSDALVARVNFYGWSPTGRRSLIEFFARSLSRGSVVNGFTDVRVSTLYAGDLVAALRVAEASGVSGVLHIAARDSTTKFEFGRATARRFGWDASLVRPALSSDVLEHARGRDLSLDVDRYLHRVGPLPMQEESLQAAFNDYSRGLADRVAAFSPEGRAR
ncbi:SDR family oxidoreductase [Microbacterium koreense]|uniref:dTDP-4-dehydrorhamnose reductase n=1 Tax=Microbacterium koreense TaxID=323761 RepID=A0ABW2ZTU9_9MICO